MLRNFRPNVPAPALAVRTMAARRRLRELFRRRVVVVGTGARAAEIAASPRSASRASSIPAVISGSSWARGSISTAPTTSRR
jgi:uncharacterized protein with ACT and thioredoxin-like domain